MKNLFLIIISICTTVVSFGQVKQIELSANIKKVTVYNSSADMHYEKEVLVPKGRTTIRFTDLTPFIEENSIRVQLDKQGVDIITVSEKINYIKDQKSNFDNVSALKDSITLYTRELGLISVKREVYEMEQSLLFKNESIGGVSKGVAVSEIEKASEFFSKRYLELATALYDLNLIEKDLQNKLKRNQNQIGQHSVNTGQAQSEISITVESATEQKVNFEFKFLTSKAGWSPMYDCKYQGSKLPLNFIFRANIFNSSGTLWKDINVTLSTANPMLDFFSPTKAIEKSNKPSQNKVSGVDYKDLQVNNAITSYEIKNKYTIASDGKPYLIDVQDYEMEANFHYLVIPSIDPFGFLMSNIPNWNTFNLIPGTMNVYNKGAYMGKTFLNSYTDNDTLQIFLGKDNTIQSNRKEQNVLNKHTLIGNFYTDKSNINMNIKNISSEVLAVEVWDLVPIIGSEEKLKLSFESIDEAIHDNNGLLTWKFKIDGNTSKVLDYNFDIKIPKNEVSLYKPKKRMYRTISCPSF